MKRVYKYPLNLGAASNGTVLSLPAGCDIVAFGFQLGTPMIWAVVDPEARTEERCFAIMGTGWDLPDDGQYVDTAIAGDYVWHLFEALS